MTTTIPC